MYLNILFSILEENEYMFSETAVAGVLIRKLL